MDERELRERGSVFKQMGEMKKKIQLVEGERKAIFEDCEREKKENKEKIKKLKEEIRILQVKGYPLCHLSIHFEIQISLTEWIEGPK